MRKRYLVRGLWVTCVLAVPAVGRAGSPGELLYAFPYPTGAEPAAGVIADVDGNLYGTTEFGGHIDLRNDQSAFGYGTVFKLSPPAGGGTQWTETVLYTFKEENGGKQHDDGAFPATPLLIGKPGVLYGTTSAGRHTTRASTVFALVPPTPPGKTWSETILHTFTSAEGSRPGSALVQDQSGALYGVLSADGPVGGGAFYKLAPPATGSTTWTETTLYAFGNVPDGRAPSGSLIMDSAGAFYGVTAVGGATNQGTVYKLTPPAAGQTAWTETILHAFAGFPHDGGSPGGGVVMDKTGALYGSTYTGGSEPGLADPQCALNGCGMVFKLTPPAAGSGSWTETVLYNFTDGAGDGAGPGGVVLDQAGDLLGPSNYRYANCSLDGAGLIFRLTKPAADQSQWSESAALGPTCHFGESTNSPLLITGQNTITATSAYGSPGALGTVFRFRVGLTAASPR